MPSRTRRRRVTKTAPAAVLVLVVLAGCSSLGDFDRLHPVLVTATSTPGSDKRPRRRPARRYRFTT
jgi:hypothetical protein